MKKYSLLFLLLPLCFSMISSDNQNEDDLFIIGSWSGVMHKKPLTIVIEKIENNIAYGYNILGTTKRSIKGKIMSVDSGGECGGNKIMYSAILKEPGTDAWDGVFKITFSHCEIIDPETDELEELSEDVSGTWKANNGKSSGSFTLLRK